MSACCQGGTLNIFCRRFGGCILLHFCHLRLASRSHIPPLIWTLFFPRQEEADRIISEQKAIQGTQNNQGCFSLHSKLRLLGPDDQWSHAPLSLISPGDVIMGGVSQDSLKQPKHLFLPHPLLHCPLF